MRWIGRLIVSVISASAFACGGSGDQGGQPPSRSTGGPAAPPDLPTTVYRFMECTECSDGELIALVALGDSAVTMLTQLILNGPPTARVNTLRRHVESRYNKVVDFSRDSEDSAWVPDRDTYVEVPIANYVATYRSRSAYALGRIRGSAARGALDSALVLDSVGVFPPRSDVSASIRSALANF